MTNFYLKVRLSKYKKQWANSYRSTLYNLTTRTGILTDLSKNYLPKTRNYIQLITIDKNHFESI